jgi:NADPH:quinone reductase-like Zn-dependent oxidoreductase
MKAIYITRPGDTGVLKTLETEIPSPKPMEVLIRVKAFGLNFADVLARMGMYPDAPKTPFVPGYEVAGTIESVGESISGFKKGDRVLAMTDFGGYAEYAVAHGLAVLPIPPSFSDAQAAALPVNALTAYFALIERGNIHPGERVLIQAAAGGVGLIAVQIARDVGATIFGTAGSEEKCQFLSDFGVHHPINYRKEDFEKSIRKITQGEGVDLVLDSLGGEALRKGYRILRSHGRLVAIGIASMVSGKTRSLPTVIKQFLKTPRFHPYRLMSEDKSFIGINLKRIAERRPDLLASALSLIGQQAIAGRIQPVLAKTFPMDQIGEAHRFLQERNAIGKVVVMVD